MASRLRISVLDQVHERGARHLIVLRVEGRVERTCKTRHFLDSCSARAIGIGRVAQNALHSSMYEGRSSGSRRIPDMTAASALETGGGPPKPLRLKLARAHQASKYFPCRRSGQSAAAGAIMLPIAAAVAKEIRVGGGGALAVLERLEGV